MTDAAGQGMGGQREEGMGPWANVELTPALKILAEWSQEDQMKKAALPQGIEARLRGVPKIVLRDPDAEYVDWPALAALVEELLVAHGIMCADSAVAAGAAWAKKAVERATEIERLQEDIANLTDSLALTEQAVRDGEQELEKLKAQLDATREHLRREQKTCLDRGMDVSALTRENARLCEAERLWKEWTREGTKMMYGDFREAMDAALAGPEEA